MPNLQYPPKRRLYTYTFRYIGWYQGSKEVNEDMVFVEMPEIWPLTGAEDSLRV